MRSDPITESSSRRTALVTGASSGIGEAFADVFAARGFDLVLTARREERLRTIAARLSTRDGCRVHVITADLADPTAPAAIARELEASGLQIDALINNAGYGLPGTYLTVPWEEHAAMLQVMVTGLVELTHRLLPGMIARRYGRIINVASLAALVPAPAGHTLYAPAKALVVRFSEALAQEVRPLGVHVTALCPGFTLSEFHDRAGTRHQVTRLPRWMWMDASTVANQGYDAVMQGIPIYINGGVNRAIAAFVKYLPYRLIAAVGRRTARLYRRTSPPPIP
jgi:short-subunit dehydrogenase